MSNIQIFDSSTTLRICEEGYDMTKQEYYSKKRCTFSCCDCFHNKCAFRVWHILLFLFIIIVIIGALVAIIAMFGPARSPDMKYSKRIGSDTPEGGCKGAEESTTVPTESSGTTKETDEKPSTAALTTTEKPSIATPTTAEKPSTTAPATTEKPSIAAPTTTEKPSTAAPTTTEKPSIAAKTTTEKPSTAAPTTTEKPSTAAPTTTEKPSTAAPTTTEKPSIAAKTTTEKPSTAAKTTTEKPTTTALTTTEKPSTVAPTTTEKQTGTAPTTTEKPTTTAAVIATAASTAGPTTAAPTTDPQRNILECDTAIVGAGAGGLLVAYSLFDKTNETNVCVFDTEDSVENIYDHVFPQVPDVVVGLGQWDISADNYAEMDLLNHLFNYNDVLWNPKTKHVEARGQFANSFDDLKLNAFPTLRDRAPLRNQTLMETAAFIYNNQRNFTQFSTAETFLSYELSPEGTKLMAENFGFKGDYMQAINPMSYRTYLKKEDHVTSSSSEAKRPPNSKGMSEIVKELTKKVESGGGKLYRKETVAFITKEGDKFLLQTNKLTVKANKTVITVGPAALKKIEGDVIRNITGHQIFESIVGVPAFYGAAVYDKPWWNDTTATQKNNSLQPLEKFISSSDCLGITMPYNGNGTSGRAVLHTIANNGGCSDKWGKLLEISKSNDVIDKELKRALKYKFQRDIPDPLETTYKYWQEGFWFFQKPGANFNSTTIRKWARRPLNGQDVFLVNRAYYDFGGYLEYTIRSAFEAVQEGWNSELVIDIYDP